MSILEIGGIAVGILVLVRGSVDERCEILRWATGVIGSSLQASSFKAYCIVQLIVLSRSLLVPISYSSILTWSRGDDEVV